MLIILIIMKLSLIVIITEKAFENNSAKDDRNVIIENMVLI